MPEYLSPGVYVEEIDAGPKPIAAVATSTAGAVGVTRTGPITPQLITSYGDFLRLYGGPLDIPDEATQSVWERRRPVLARRRVGQGVLRRGRRRACTSSASQPGGAVASSRGLQRRPVRAGADRRRSDFDHHRPLTCRRHRRRQPRSMWSATTARCSAR